MSDLTPVAIDEWSTHLWHTSQHNRMVIGLGGRLQSLANEMRRAAGLTEFGWNDAFPDARFRECSVHVEDCAGQETHMIASRSGEQPPVPATPGNREGTGGTIEGAANA